nr:MAG TPA: hypothetical protein [Caudoviricetes sp.]
MVLLYHSLSGIVKGFHKNNGLNLGFFLFLSRYFMLFEDCLKPSGHLHQKIFSNHLRILCRNNFLLFARSIGFDEDVTPAFDEDCIGTRTEFIKRHGLSPPFWIPLIVSDISRMISAMSIISFDTEESASSVSNSLFDGKLSFSCICPSTRRICIISK